jgi:alkylhydroperoxidase family enzyme
MGHQEIKLAVAGMTDDQIAALDCDWDQYSVAEQVAFAFACKLTHEPYRVGRADIDGLRKHYKDLQILEIIVALGGYSSLNRWTDALGIPQDEAPGRLFKGAGREGARPPTLLTATSPKYQNQLSKVAPLAQGSKGTAASRPPLESRGEAEAALTACRARSSFFPLVDKDKARALLPPDWPAGPLPNWVRLLANFPKAGKARIQGLQAAAQKGTLSPLLKAQVAWIAARQDRAWYALGQAKNRLAALGLADDAIFALDGPWGRYTPGEQLAFAFARKLTSNPAEITDQDIADLRKHYKDGEVAELVLHLANAAFFNRVTEASGLRLEDE